MAALRPLSRGRKLSFDVLNSVTTDSDDDDSLLLYRSLSDHQNGDASNPNRRKRKNKKKKKSAIESAISVEDSSIVNRDFVANYSVQRAVVREEEVCTVLVDEAVGAVVAELRQRNVGGSRGDFGGNKVEERVEESVGMAVTMEEERERKELEPNGRERMELERNMGTGSVRMLETEESLDWKKLMAQDPNHAFAVEKSPLKYFMEEMYNGNSLRSTTTLGNDKERERVYDTIFRLPWRCEVLINVGFFVCLDSFLSLLTIMPTRILMAVWRILKIRQFERPSVEELSDAGCFIILSCGVALLEQADISLIYHMIRGQGTIKLYVVYNVLEIFDKLCQNFGGDVLQTLFSSAEGLANSSPDTMRQWIWRFISDEMLAMASSVVHSFILLAQAITLSTCIVAHNNALLALLVSNNFAEIKSNVFKRFSKDNVHSMVYSDSIERFHISAFLIFVLAQNILEAEGSWFESFLTNALLVYICEMMIDIIKHSFIAKFNDLKPIAYSEFLEDLCKQTLNMETDNGKKHLTFVPLAPACVVIRVLAPIYAAHLPYSPLPWRLFWILLLFAMTFIMLASLKVMIRMGLKKHAKWYINRCQKRKLHTD